MASKKPTINPTKDPTASPTVSPIVSTFFEIIQRHIWTRQNGQLIYVSNQGSITYGEAMRKLSSNMQAFSSIVHPESGCKKYITHCIINKDNNVACKPADQLSTTSMDKNIKEEINNMHPAVAIKTLKSFGFKKFEKHNDENQKGLFMVEPVSKWLETSIKSAFSTNPGIINCIKKNHGLLTYLDLITRYVNSNPAILNTKKTSSKHTLKSMDKSHIEYDNNYMYDDNINYKLYKRYFVNNYNKYDDVYGQSIQEENAVSIRNDIFVMDAILLILIMLICLCICCGIMCLLKMIFKENSNEKQLTVSHNDANKVNGVNIHINHISEK